MKKSLLLIFSLLLVVSAFAYNPRQFYQQILIEDADIMDHVTAVDPAHEANFSVLVEEVATGNTLSSSVNTLLARVCTLDIGAGVAWAWVFFDAQGLPTAGNVPEGATFTINLTYLPNTDPLTNTVTHTVVAPGGVDAIFNFYYPDFGMDSAWTLPQTLFGGGGPTEYTLAVTSNYAGADIFKDGVDTGENTPHTFDPAEAGTYTLQMPGVAWTPTEYVYTAEADETAAFTGVMTPAVTTPVSPADGATLEWPFGTADQPVTLEWNAVAGVTGYKLAWNGAPAQDLGNVLTFNTPPIGEGSYIWQVIPYITDPVAKGGKRSLAPVGARVAMNAPKGDAVEAPLWHFTINVLDPVVHNLVITSNPAGATILLGGVATENITPFTVTAAGTYSVMMDGYTFLPEDYIWDGAADDEIEFVGTLIPTYDVIPGVPEELDPATDVTITGAGFIGANLVTEGYTPVPNPTFVATSEGILQLVGTGEVSLTFDFDPAVDWFVYLEGGEWIAVAGPHTTYTVIVDLGAKDGTFEYKAGSGEDPTLPVELSVFNATLTAQNFVKLSWTSESETNMLGYRVYRAESEVQAEAILITPIMIQATNTSTTQNYSIEDREVNIGTTYYYWLEAVDYSHSSFFGHRSVEVLGEITPELPVQSVMSNAYPNPFRASSNTTIEVKVRADETGTVTIYNVLGQAVKTYTVSEGNHKLTWNGRDSRGNLCGSGIYFARMSTPSMNQTKKMVIVK